MDSLDRENPQVNARTTKLSQQTLWLESKVWIPSDNEDGWEEVWRRIGSNMVMYYGDLADTDWEVVGVLNPMFESAFTSESYAPHFTLNLMPGIRRSGDEISEDQLPRFNPYMKSIHCVSIVILSEKETN